MKKFFKSIGKKSNNAGKEHASNRRPSSGSIDSSGSYSVGKIKDLPKIHKAVVTNDVDKVIELARKEVKATDKNNRYVMYLLVH